MANVRASSRWTIEIVRTVLILVIVLSIGAVYTARGDNHDQTYYACLFAGSLSQVNTNAPPANCGRGIQIEWSSFGGTIDASMIADGSIPGSVIQEGTLPGSAIEDDSIEPAKLVEALQQDIKCGAFAHSGVDWSGCFLRGAYLVYADLPSANLSNTNLNFADLTDADLTDASLFDANLLRAYLVDADLTNANLTGADLTNVTWNNTTCPNGSVVTGVPCSP